jgi:hypothetical protein
VRVSRGGEAGALGGRRGADDAPKIAATNGGWRGWREGDRVGGFEDGAGGDGVLSVCDSARVVSLMVSALPMLDGAMVVYLEDMLPAAVCSAVSMLSSMSDGQGRHPESECISDLPLGMATCQRDRVRGTSMSKGQGRHVAMPSGMSEMFSDSGVRGPGIHKNTARGRLQIAADEAAGLVDEIVGGLLSLVRSHARSGGDSGRRSCVRSALGLSGAEGEDAAYAVARRALAMLRGALATSCGCMEAGEEGGGGPEEKRGLGVGERWHGLWEYFAGGKEARTQDDVEEREFEACDWRETNVDIKLMAEAGGGRRVRRGKRVEIEILPC